MEAELVGPSIRVAELAVMSFEGLAPGTAVDLIVLTTIDGANGSTRHYHWQA